MTGRKKIKRIYPAPRFLIWFLLISVVLGISVKSALNQDVQPALLHDYLNEIASEQKLEAGNKNHYFLTTDLSSLLSFTPLTDIKNFAESYFYRHQILNFHYPLIIYKIHPREYTAQG